MDWAPYYLLGVSSFLTVAGYFFIRTISTLSRHTVTLTQLVDKLRPMDKIVDEIIELKISHATLKTRVDTLTAQTETAGAQPTTVLPQ